MIADRYLRLKAELEGAFAGLIKLGSEMRRPGEQLNTLQALLRVQEDEAARRLLAPEREPRWPRSLVQQLPRRVLPGVVRGEPRRLQQPPAHVLSPEPRAPARVQP